MKKTLRSALILSTLAAAALACSFSPRLATQQAPTENTLPAPTTAPTPGPTAAPAVNLSPRSIQETSETPKYTIDIAYPYLESGAPYAYLFNAQVDQFTAGLVDSFKQNATEVESWRAENMPEAGSDLIVQYEVLNTENGIISVHFNISSYAAGAAHPNNYSSALNFDLPAGEVLTLDDLFIPGSNYFEMLSAYCIQDLKQQGTLGWEEGAAPKPENFQNWNITPGGLRITFDPYQVAAYAAGPQKVEIPYNSILKAIKPDGPLAAFMP